MRRAASLTAFLCLTAAVVAAHFSAPLPQTQFPEVAPRSSVRIAFDQHEGYLGGRAYRVEVHGDGRAWFKAVTVFGNRANIPLQVKPAAVEALIARFRGAAFFSLKPAYIADVTHIASTEITLCIDLWCKTVTERMGLLAQMPAGYGGLAGDIVDSAGATGLVETFR